MLIKFAPPALIVLGIATIAGAIAAVAPTLAVGFVGACLTIAGFALLEVGGGGKG